MLVSTTIQVELEPNEKAIIKKAGSILKELCENFEECEQCPLGNTCGNVTRPHLIIRELVKTFEKPLTNQ